MMRPWTKITGTTYYTIPEDRMPAPLCRSFYRHGFGNGQGSDVPCCLFAGRLDPQPENPYDRHAVQVNLLDGNGSACQLGYLPRTEERRKGIHAPVDVVIVRLSYDQVGAGLNPSYRIYGLDGVVGGLDLIGQMQQVSRILEMPGSSAGTDEGTMMTKTSGRL